MKFAKTILSTLSAAALGLLALGLSSAPVQAAATATTTFAVTATVQASCSVTATALAFGTYSSLAASTSTSSVSVTCTTTTPYTLGLNAGLNGTVPARAMKSGAVLLNYGLFTDAAYTTNFATLASANGTGSAVATTVYGQIPASQYVTPGAYTDTITATVTY
jgi:spore coat protein U-like protein